MKFKLISRQTVAHTTIHELNIPAGNKICGMRLENARPISVTLDRTDLTDLLQLQPDQLYSYLRIILTTLA